MGTPDFYIYRRDLPHWRMQGAVYFVTWRLHPGQADLSPVERGLVASVIKHFDGERYKLYAYVVMNDHAHALLRLLEAHSLQQVMQSWKSFTAHQLQRQHGRQGAVWQREYLDRIMRDEAEFWEKANYIISNPRRRWPELTSYEWVEWFPLE